MKKFLAIVVLFTLCGTAFSVTGSLYVRYKGGSEVVATEYQDIGPLHDLATGRKGSGFDLNFETFGITYKLRDPLGYNSDTSSGPTVSATAFYNLANSYINIYTPKKGSLIATSPGYIGLTGIKIGTLNFSTGGSWWHFDESQNQVDASNAATTNVNKDSSANFNLGALDFYGSLPINDNIKIDVYPWDRINGWLGIGGAAVNDNFNHQTNSADSFVYGLVGGIHLNLSLEKLGIEIFPKVQMQGNMENKITGIGYNTTNKLAASELGFGGMIRASFLVNESFGYYAHVGYWHDDVAYQTIQNSTTNQDKLTFANDIPIMAGISIKPAASITLNLGVGYIIALNNGVYDNAAHTTNITGSGLQSEYKAFDEHGYQNPFLRFSGKSQFNENWELGLCMEIRLWASSEVTKAGQTGNYFTSTSTVNGNSYTSSSSYQLFHFDQNFSFDANGAGPNAAYIQYSKDGVTLKGLFGGSIGGGGGSLFGLFGTLDMSLAF
jgi:hypothetical protein